jgi:hypothetical protein
MENLLHRLDEASQRVYGNMPQHPWRMPAALCRLDASLELPVKATVKRNWEKSCTFPLARKKFPLYTVSIEFSML